MRHKIDNVDVNLCLEIEDTTTDNLERLIDKVTESAVVIIASVTVAKIVHKIL